MRSTHFIKNTALITPNRRQIMTFLGLISLIALTSITPATPATAQATSTSSLDLTVSLDPVLSLAVVTPPGEINLSSGEFGSTSMVVRVSTNSLDGYTLSMADNDNTAELTAEDEHNPSVIENLSVSVILTGAPSGAAPSGAAPSGAASSDTASSGTSSSSTSEEGYGSNFPAGRWGYSLDNATYLPIPLASSPSNIKETEENDMDGDDAIIYFGSRVASSFPGGEYSDVVVFSAIANPVAPSFYRITTMQQMTANVCSSVQTPEAITGTEAEAVLADTYAKYQEYGAGTAIPERTLIDERDGQEYTVRKLADGNCWMGENLRYGINPDDTAHPFVAEDADLTDLPEDPTERANAIAKMLDLTYDTENPQTAGRIKTAASGNKTNDGSADAFKQDFEGFEEPYINVYQANAKNSYNGRTKYGTLYNYCAATSGTGCTNSTTRATPSGSICPLGWAMPSYDELSTATPTGNEPDQSFQKLLSNYGIANMSDPTPVDATPLDFVRAGYLSDTTNGSIIYRNSTGGLFATSQANNYNAYTLDFRQTEVYRDAGGARSDGVSLRCVAK